MSRPPLSHILLVLGLCYGCSGAPGTPGDTVPLEGPVTRPEATAYQETSSHADVLAFLDSLENLGVPITRGVLGRSPAGHEIPFVVASRPRVSTPDEARSLGRPIIYVQGNIHGGEVEGKEALQMILRDLTLDPRPNPLDSLVLIAVPIFNVDGNESLAPQSVNRTEQNGPELVGERVNGQGLDLNRDYVKAVSPEARGSLELFGRWDPELLVDLHATNGSYHGYALTYSPSLHPSAGPAGRLTRDELLPELRRRMHDRHGFDTFDYGNFSREYGADVTPDTVRDGWFTYDHRPRFGTNYYALRGRASILSEAYSRDPFDRRVASTYAFVREILSLAAERADALRALRDADPLASLGGEIALRGELTRSPFLGEVIMEVLEADPDSTPAEPGVHPGIRRTGRFRTIRIPVHDRFDATLVRSAPAAYAFPAADTAVTRLLELHGVRIERTNEAGARQVEVFAIDGVDRSARSFQGYREVRLDGSWRTEERLLPPGTVVVPMDQPLAVVAAYLLEPESDDGIATWSSPDGSAPARPFFGFDLAPGTEFPVVRLTR
jgi:hypothetical protein